MPKVHAPIHGLTLGRGGNLKPYYNPRGNGLGDIRHVSGESFLSVQKLWRERGDEILNRVADKYPELVFMGLIKLSQVTKFEVGSPGDFTKLGSRQAITEKLEQKAGPEARKLFEKFVGRSCSDKLETASVNRREGSAPRLSEEASLNEAI